MIDFVSRQPGVPVKGRPLIVSVHVKNVGKSLALNTAVHRHLGFGERDIQNMRIEPPDTRKTGDTTAQGDQFTTSAVSIKDTYANETVEIKESDLVTWDGTEPIVVWGRITYEDAFGNLYCTPYASSYLHSNAWLKTGIFRRSGGKVVDDRSVTDLCPTGAGKVF